ncbi:MAG: LPS export ABC transporter periplasmic protein LptC [Chryseolinea sp.]
MLSPNTIQKAQVILLSVSMTLFGQCSTGENKEPIEYKGPVSEMENVELFYTENEKVKVKMLADLLYEFESGDREFPKGVYIEFFGPDGATISSTLKADHAYYFKKEDHWRGRRNVEVKNLAKNEQLNTEELFWRPRDRKIFTDKFVTIRQQNDVLYGQGLTANEDLSDYVIQKPYGDMDVKEE